MSGTGGQDTIHGASIPSPRWWRRYRDIPLIVLLVVSLVAAVVGWTTQFQLDRAAALPAPPSPTPGAGEPASAVAAACRAPVPGYDAEPWLGDAAKASAVWTANADSLADPVVLGRDGWAFYNDQIEESFSQSIGRRFLTTEQVEQWHSYFEGVATALRERGIEFTIQVTPSAASVYPQQLPEWTDGIRGSTPLDQVLAASPDLPIVDFRADLREASASDAVYTPVNSHWTDWGGYVGWQTYTQCRSALYPDSAALAVPAVSGVRSEGVFNEYASYGVPDADPEWTAPEFAEALAPVEVTDSAGTVTESPGEEAVDLAALPASTVTAAARSEQTALILRDSMGSALSPYWTQQYAETWQIQHRYDDWSSPPNFSDLVDQYDPDVVIVQLAERHLINAPTAPSGY